MQSGKILIGTFIIRYLRGDENFLKVCRNVTVFINYGILGVLETLFLAKQPLITRRPKQG